MITAMNTAMEPYRALVGDKVNHEQRPLAYALQSFMVAAGQVLAGLMPLIMIAFGVSVETDGKEIPEIVKYSFIVGVVVILSSSVWSFYKTDEIPPEDMEAFEKEKAKKKTEYDKLISEADGLLGSSKYEDATKKYTPYPPPY